MLHRGGFARLTASLAVSVGLAACVQANAWADAGTEAKRTAAAAKARVDLAVRAADTEEPIANAVLLFSEGGRRIEAATDKSGHAVVVLAPGKWKVSVSAPGMLAQARKLELAAGEQRSLAVRLPELETSELVQVKEGRNLLHARNPAPTTYINKDIIEKYKQGNDLRALVATAPGITQDSFGNMVARGEHNTVNYVLDDVVLPEAVGQMQQGQVASPHSLASMSVTTGGYSAKDGGGPMGAVVRLQSLPIQSKPTLQLNTQLGGPLAGGINYVGSTALSQDRNSAWNRVRVQSSGQIFANKLGVQPPTRHFTRDGRLDINLLNKVEWQITDRDRLRLTASINETYMHIPTPRISRSFGFKENQHDRQNYLILSYRHRFAKWLDEANLHLVNGFYSQRLGSTNVFNPEPIINGEADQIVSASPNAKRFNYVFSAQGDVRKTVFHTHHLTAGFLSEVRPVKTYFSAFYYNADLNSTRNAQLAAEQARAAAIQQVTDTTRQQAVANALANGANANSAYWAGEQAAQQALNNTSANGAQAAGAAAAAAVPQIPYGGLISPFTGLPGGPQMQGPVGNFSGFRYLQSAYLQDSWTPERGALKRLTVDAGVRLDVYHGVFGNTLNLASMLAQQPGIDRFLVKPFQTNRVTNAQVSGRYAASYKLTKRTVMRSSYAQVFTPPPVDLFVRPFDITSGTINGIWNGALRPMQATRGRIVDASIEQQLGARFSFRTGAYYKWLHNVGDELPVNNTVLYQRLTLSGLASYGVENLLELKPARDGTGLFGFASNTVMVAKLTGNHKDSGGIYDITPTPGTAKYIDHDRRESLSAGLGWKTKNGFWVMSNITAATGFLIGLDPALFGAHPARSRPVVLVGLNFGWNAPAGKKHDKLWHPVGADVRITNIANNVVPINIGSPFQGTRYTLPLQVLAQLHWAI